MSLSDSSLDAAAVARARRLLEPRKRRDPMWPALVAATALAVTSVVFATIMVLAPPLETQHTAESAPDPVPWGPEAGPETPQ
jgi:hypothetical protein